MNEAIKKFKISNMPDSYTAFLLPVSIMVFIVGGGLTLCSLGLSAYIPDVLRLDRFYTDNPGLRNSCPDRCRHES